MMNEQHFEKLLNIETAGFQYGYPKSVEYHRYEPTPYSALQQLFEYYTLPEVPVVVDFGCGKGRVPIYLHHLFNVSTLGVEMDQKFFVEAEHNKEQYFRKSYQKKQELSFLHLLAEEYEVRDEDNVFFFFNPFSVQIFRKVLTNIYQSFERNLREMHFVFYYPSEAYMEYIRYETTLELKHEVKLKGNRNPNERICVFILK